MILHPAILALCVGSLGSALATLYAAWYGMRILKRWDISSGSELQLDLERRTYLVATLVSGICLLHLLSLFLYIFTADHLHTLFTGAMCAAGTLNVNAYGYPLLLLKIVIFLLAGLWLITHHLDSQGHDYPLIRIKYRMLLGMLPLVVAECLLTVVYFGSLQADVITSCCGALFSATRPGLAGELTAAPVRPMMALFFAAIPVWLFSGWLLCAKKKGAPAFSVLSAFFFPLALLALITFIGPYVYNLPSHHCPFCLLQGEAHHVGYVLYVTLLGGCLSGLGVGMLSCFRGRRSIEQFISPLQRRLALLTILLYLSFVAVAGYAIVFSPLALL